MKKFLALLLLATQAFATSPILWGPNSQAVNLQNQIIHTTGALSQNDGRKNYIAYGNFENAATTGWSLGHVTLTSGLPTGVPTFGSGADSHLSLSTTGPTGLANRSLVYSTSTATVAGDFVASQAYTINNADQAKVLQIKFDYEVFSGVSQAPTNFNLSGTSSNSFGVAIYDVTNSAWIIPAGVWNIVQGTGAGTYLGTFQTPISMTQFRLVFFNANATTGTGSTLWLDSFFTGPQITATGVPASDPVSYTPTFTGLGTPSSTTARWERLANKIHVWGNTTSGTSTSASLGLSLPSGISIDTTLATAATAQFGLMNRLISGGEHPSTGQGPWPLFYDGSDATVVFVGASTTQSDNAGTFGKQNASNVVSAGQVLSFDFTVPVSGWGANAAMSNDTDTRIVSAIVTQSANVSCTQGNPIILPVVTYDSHGAYNASTGIYTVPVTGVYDITGVGQTTVGQVVYLQKNGTTVQVLGVVNPANTVTSFAGQIKVTAGDTLAILCGATSTYSYSAVSGTSGQAAIFTFARRSGPAVVAASEKVYVNYVDNSGGAVTANVTNVTFNTKKVDSHNAWNGTVFTMPRPGFCIISECMQFTATANVGQYLWINGAQTTYLGPGNSNSSVTCGSGGTYLNTGDTMSIRIDGTLTLTSNAHSNSISISCQ